MASDSRSSTLIQFPTIEDGCFSPTHQLSLKGTDWRLCVHPQGWIYFYNPSLKLVTDHDIRQIEIYERTAQCYSDYPLSDVDEGMEVQLYLQSPKYLQKETSENAMTLNLAINHNHCVASHKLYEVKNDNCLSLSPTKLNRCRRLYWNYLWNHPAHVPTPSRALRDASDALTWFYTDNLISGPKSTVPFSKSECEELSRVVRELAVFNEDSISKTVFLAWLLREVCSYRDAENWGQMTHKEAQIHRSTRSNQPQPQTRPRSPFALSLLNFMINFLFFGIPHTYRAHVKMASEYRGRLSSVQKVWENYIERLVREYSHFLLISTVLLSATVGFLSVPDIPEASQVTSTISTFASLGSIIVGVFSIWRHQASSTTADSFTYMHNVQHGTLGVHGYAVLLSLPASLLVWAILTFTISVVLYAMHGLAQGGTWATISSWAVLGIFIIMLSTVSLALYTFSIIWKFQRRTARLWHHFTSLWTWTKTEKDDNV